MKAGRRRQPSYSFPDLLFALFEIYVKFCSAVVIYAVLSRDNFCRKFTHFWVENFQALKFASVKKRTNIRYVRPPCSWLAWVSTHKWVRIWKLSRIACKRSKRLFVLVHGRQDSAYGVWFGEGNIQYLLEYRNYNFCLNIMKYFFFFFTQVWFIIVSSWCRGTGRSTTGRTKTCFMWLSRSLSLFCR